MIKKFRVKAFKSLESVEVELGQVNVFVGPNGSGKSNLLEALGVLGAAASGRVDDESLLRRGVRPGVPRLYKSSFPRTRKENVPHVSFSAETEDATYEVSLWNPLEDPSPAWRYKTEVLGERGGQNLVGRAPFRPLNPEQGYAALKAVELESGKPALVLLNLLRNYSIYCANSPTLRGLVPDPQTREPVGLSGGRLPDALRELIQAQQEGYPSRGFMAREVLPLIDWARAFGSSPSASMPLSESASSSKNVVRFVDRYMAEKRNVLSGYDASEGALYILFAAVLILHPKSPRCFAIDNVDQALNPRLAQRLSESMCKWTLEANTGRQVILTAHNPAVLDGLPLDDDRIRLFVVDRDNRGHTVANRVNVDEGILRKAKEGWTLSRLWMMGHLGGVPNV